MLPIVETCLAFAPNLTSACDRDLQSSEKVRTAVQTFAQFIAATASANAEIYHRFAEDVDYVGTPQSV